MYDVNLAWKLQGHLNSAAGQWAEVILERARKDERFKTIVHNLDASVANWPQSEGVGPAERRQ